MASAMATKCLLLPKQLLFSHEFKKLIPTSSEKSALWVFCLNPSRNFRSSHCSGPCSSFLLVRFLGNCGDICVSQGVLWMFELRRWGLAAVCCSLVLKSWWERGFIRQPEEVEKCSIPSSELNQIRVFSIKTAFPTCLSCSSERYELSPQTLHLHHRASGRLLKSLCVQQENQELFWRCSISRAAWERRSRQGPRCRRSSITWPRANQTAAQAPRFPHQQNNNRKISFLVRSIPSVSGEGVPAPGRGWSEMGFKVPSRPFCGSVGMWRMPWKAQVAVVSVVLKTDADVNPVSACSVRSGFGLGFVGICLPVPAGIAVEFRDWFLQLEPLIAWH